MLYARISIADAVLRDSFGVHVKYGLGFEKGIWLPQSQMHLPKMEPLGRVSPFEVDAWLKDIVAISVALQTLFNLWLLLKL